MVVRWFLLLLLLFFATSSSQTKGPHPPREAFTLLRCSLRSLRSVARSSKDRSGLERSRGWAERLKRVIPVEPEINRYNDVIWIIQYNSR
jgi:hypothetical protein